MISQRQIGSTGFGQCSQSTLEHEIASELLGLRCMADALHAAKNIHLVSYKLDTSFLVGLMQSFLTQDRFMLNVIVAI